MPKFLDVPQWYGADGIIKQGLGKEELCLCTSFVETTLSSSYKATLRIFFLASSAFVDRMKDEGKYYSLLGDVELPAVGMVINPLTNNPVNITSVEIRSEGKIGCNTVYFSNSAIKTLQIQINSSNFSESALVRNIELTSFYG